MLSTQDKLNLISKENVDNLSRVVERYLYAPEVKKNFPLNATEKEKKANLFSIFMAAMEMEISFTQALKGFVVIKSTLSMKSDLMLALVYRSKEVEFFEEKTIGSLAQNDAKAVCTIKRKGHKQHVTTFSISDAKKAKLWEPRKKDGTPNTTSPWRTYPLRMLQLRARGFALRDSFQDTIQGHITYEEVRDYPIEPESDVAEGYISTPRIEGPKEDTEPSEPTIEIHTSKLFKEKFILDSNGSAHLASGIIYSREELEKNKTFSDQVKKLVYDEKMSNEMGNENKFPVNMQQEEEK